MTSSRSGGTQVVPVVIPDDRPLFAPDDSKEREGGKFCYPSEYDGHLAGVLVPYTDIVERTSALARVIKTDYEGSRPLIICLLKGAGPFYQLLLQALNREKQGYTCDYIRAKSYEGTGSTGNVRVSGMDLDSVKDKHVIIVEDIVDTGTTLSHMLPLFRAEGCRSLEVCSLLEKRVDGTNHQSKVPVKYSGFSIPNKFVIGYGLDFNEQFRDLEDIWVISEGGIANGGNYDN